MGHKIEGTFRQYRLLMDRRRHFARTWRDRLGFWEIAPLYWELCAITNATVVANALVQQAARAIVAGEETVDDQTDLLRLGSEWDQSTALWQDVWQQCLAVLDARAARELELMRHTGS